MKKMIRINLSKVTIPQIKKHIRRWFLVVFRPYYVIERLSQRRGECSHCGCCSESCKDYNAPDCLRWNNLPFICKLFPIDEKDKGEYKDRCTFYWKK